jgi:hypothetical protein
VGEAFLFRGAVMGTSNNDTSGGVARGGVLQAAAWMADAGGDATACAMLLLTRFFDDAGCGGGLRSQVELRTALVAGCRSDLLRV